MNFSNVIAYIDVFEPLLFELFSLIGLEATKTVVNL